MLDKKLFRPLSAKVLPRGYAFTMGSIEVSREEQINQKRRKDRENAAGPKKDKRGTPHGKYA